MAVHPWILRTQTQRDTQKQTADNRQSPERRIWVTAGSRDRQITPARYKDGLFVSSAATAINNFLPFILQCSVLPVNLWPLTHDLLHPDLWPLTSGGHGQCPAVYHSIFPLFLKFPSHSAWGYFAYELSSILLLAKPHQSSRIAWKWATWRKKMTEGLRGGIAVDAALTSVISTEIETRCRDDERWEAGGRGVEGRWRGGGK